MKWRIIGPETLDAATNMAVDHAIYKAVSEGLSPPTIRLYSWEGGGVSIGKGINSSIVNIEACDKARIPYVRRPTGGNVVYHDKGDITYAVIAPNTLFDPEFKGVMKDGGEAINRAAYTTIREWIVSALASIGIEAKLYGKNDIVIGENKIVGNAQTLCDKAFLQHGSIFFTTTAEGWANVLNLPYEKISTIKGISEMVSGDEERVYFALFNAFTKNKIVDGDCGVGTLSSVEQAMVEKLLETEYSKDQFLGSGSERKGTACATDILDD